MILYRFMLEDFYNKKPVIKMERCEAEEKPKSYKLIESFGRTLVRKEDIGHFLNDWQSSVYFLEEDIKAYKDLLRNRYEFRREQAQRKVDECNLILGICESEE